MIKVLVVIGSDRDNFHSGMSELFLRHPGDIKESEPVREVSTHHLGKFAEF